MSEFKITGHCTTCDCEVFEIITRQAEHERRPGEPKRIGGPLDNAIRITFLLFDGTKTDLTFCEDCAADLEPARYVAIWRKNLRSWMRELSGRQDELPDWLVKQFSGGLLCELGRKKWKELLAHG